MAQDRHSLIGKAEALLSDEQGTVFKSAPFRIALAYPSPYNVGMSSLGYQTIYRELNSLPGIVAERVFLPDDVEAHRQSRTPPFSLESRSPISEFNVIAFSV